MVSGGTVTGDLNNMKNFFTKLDTEIDGLSGVWKGSSYDNCKVKVDEMISEYSGVISSEMTSFASACDLYLEYEQTKHSISSLRSNPEENSGQISSLQSKLSQLKSQIESLLSSASAGVLEGASSGSSSLTFTSALGTPSYGTFEPQSFTASNGTTIQYYLYRPSYNGTTDVSGLPVIMYMHGSGSKLNMTTVLTHGLSLELKNRTVNPSGICIIPLIDSFGKKTEPVLKELTDYVVETYHADPNRISISGHSSGGMMTYRMINSYPNYYAAAIPISGFTDITDAFKTVRVWAFNGALDRGQLTSNAGAAAAVNKINSIGGDATLYTYQGSGHARVQDYTYQREFTSPDGDVTTPLEWAFRQVKPN